MGRTRRSEKTDFEGSPEKKGKRRNHARNIPGVGMKVYNSYECDDNIELDEDIAIYLNNTRLIKHIT